MSNYREARQEMSLIKKIRDKRQTKKDDRNRQCDDLLVKFANAVNEAQPTRGIQKYMVKEFEKDE